MILIATPQAPRAGCTHADTAWGVAVSAIERCAAMPDLTPIQTAYNGHHFRSRLEARWAVFFDALGVKYEYEAEGYDLDGVWYLPDFWLPEVGAYVEIKPATEEDEDGGMPHHHQASHLAGLSGKWVIVVFGNPWPHDYAATLYSSSSVMWFPMQFGCSTDCPQELWLFGLHGMTRLNRATPGRKSVTLTDPIMEDAYRAARSARFEHGQSGRTL